MKIQDKNSLVISDELQCDNKLLECCTKCKENVVTLCEIFHQLKTRELKLDWKLDRLARAIKHANKVPARWINFNNILAEHFQNNLTKKVTGQNQIRKFRQNVLKAGN